MAFFSDLLKKWFYQNSSSAASNDARIPLLTATGEPKGSDTMANLASVLGAQIPALLSSFDANDYTESCAYFVKATEKTHVPVDSWAFFIVKKSKDTGHFTQFWLPDGSDNVYYRRGYNSTFNNWVRFSFNVPDFYKNYNNINELSAGVGVRHFTIEAAANVAIDETITLGVTSPLFTIALNGSGPSGVFFSPYWHSDVTTITKSEDFYTFTRNGTTLRVQAPAQTYSIEIKICVFSWE